MPNFGMHGKENSLQCPRNEIKLEQNSFETVFETVLFQFHFYMRSVFRRSSLRPSRSTQMKNMRS